MPRSHRSARVRLLPLVLSIAAPAAVPAQSAPHCHVLCAPTVTLMPALLRTHIVAAPRVLTLATGAEHRLPSTSSFEMIVAAAAPTAIPRLSVYGSVQWLPNATTSRNPFTLYTASELGTGIRANAPTWSAGASVSVLAATETRGWLDAAVNVADLFSQAARPEDKSSYTHKLDLELLAHVRPFAAGAPTTWLHRVAAFALLDYVATGLPRAGDEVPVGRRFVSAARPLALVAGLALPITPSGK